MSVLTLNASYWGHILSDGTDSENPIPVFQGGNITKVGICRSYCKWSLADLPSGATISQVRFKLTIGSAGGAAGVWDIHAYNSTGQTDPDVDTGVTKYNRCASGNLYNNDTTTWRSTGSTWITLGGAIATDVQNAKSAVNRFSLAAHEEGDNDDSSNATGAGASIQLEITYTVAGGTNMKLNIGDSWKTVDSSKLNVGDSWKAVTGAKVNVGDTWKTVF